ncbi:MAG: phosphatase, partial [Desulfonatronovibrio sp.]|nr:phosphatase [Desulfovibrionales bacterium]
LKQENATVILAHPFSLKVGNETLKNELMRLKDMGLDGVEVYYPEHTKEQTRAYEDMCNELGLLLSGGSDFHGSVKPHIKLGKGKGKLNMPYSIVETMKRTRAEQGLWT